MAMANRAPFDEFDPTELQDGVLTPVGNVHERLREARERHPVMLGNAFTEVTSETIRSLVTVLGHDECHRVLTDPDTFSSSVYLQIMGPIMGRTLAGLEGAEHRTSRALVSPSFRAKDARQNNLGFRCRGGYGCDNGRHGGSRGLGGVEVHGAAPAPG
jgi:cytochrome P450